MAEEYQESEVIFNENQRIIEEYIDENDYNIDGYSNSKSKRKKLRAKKINSSVPMNIPATANNINININARNSSWFQVTDTTDFSDDDDHNHGGDGGEILPPHMIIRRRVAGKVMPFSVCSGNGRTLKGRDLSEVRNSILRLTGFLET